MESSFTRELANSPNRTVVPPKGGGQGPISNILINPESIYFIYNEIFQ
jgi:hypothetical protein